MMKGMIRLIINADDIGLHPAVNRAVLSLAKFGTMTSASVMANGLYFDEIPELKNHISLGAHLNILRGKPISDPKEIPSLVTEKNQFIGDYKTLYLKYLTRKLNVQEVKHEWRNQILKLKAMDIPISHIDSEKHTHAWPQLARIARELADEFHIPCLRKPSESQIPFSAGLSGVVRTTLLNMWCTCASEAYETKSPDHAWGIGNQGENLTPKHFEAYLKSIKSPQTIELICHPGHVLPGDPPIDPSYGNLRIHHTWEVEYQNLLKNGWKKLFLEPKVQLTSYSLD
jgi:predicted glycoside hydrolase/deacetylase ChbG (UPF0249 family)